MPSLKTCLLVYVAALSVACALTAFFTLSITEKYNAEIRYALKSDYSVGQISNPNAALITGWSPPPAALPQRTFSTVQPSPRQEVGDSFEAIEDWEQESTPWVIDLPIKPAGQEVNTLHLR